MSEGEQYEREYRRAMNRVVLGVFIGTVPWWVEFGWKVIFLAIGMWVLIEVVGRLWDWLTNA